jgi:hypothetical protein
LLEPFLLTNAYGLFAVMTTERPEIVIEASLDGRHFRPYEFRYKPGRPRGRPRFAAPHLPRLDWQLWFAAIDSSQRRWVRSLLVRLLEAEPSVLRLFRLAPFGAERPKLVRATLYDYRFADPATFRKSRAWWKRRELGPYLPALELQPPAGADEPPSVRRAWPPGDAISTGTDAGRNR